MKPSNYDFRQFQEDLAALDRKSEPQAKERHMPRNASSGDRLAQARAEFMVLCERYSLTVADVVAFFPEEQGIAYLQGLIAGQEAKGKRRPKKPG